MKKHLSLVRPVLQEYMVRDSTCTWWCIGHTSLTHSYLMKHSPPTFCMTFKTLFSVSHIFFVFLLFFYRAHPSRSPIHNKCLHNLQILIYQCGMTPLFPSLLPLWKGDWGLMLQSFVLQSLVQPIFAWPIYFSSFISPLSFFFFSISHYPLLS